MKNYREILTETNIIETILLENTKALKDLKSLVKKEKEAKKTKDKGEFLDYFYTKYEKEINKIEKKYQLGLDELGELLMKL